MGRAAQFGLMQFYLCPTRVPELAGKRLELLREVLPGLARVAVLWDPANPYIDFFAAVHESAFGTKRTC